MLSSVTQCAERMFGQGHFKVKVIFIGPHTVVSAQYLEPQVIFTNNSEQMSSMMNRCAVRILDHGRFKVKVIVQG